MNVEIINVGTELLLGEIVNTNATYLQKFCKELGFDVYYQSVVGDNPERFTDCLRIAFERGADCVITTGGLGPTTDDLTKELSAEFLGLTPEYIEEEAEKVAAKCRFLSGQEEVPENNFKQAFFPKGCTILENEVGTANGCILEQGGKMIVNLPGPPKEMTLMVDAQLRPLFEKYRRETLYTRDIITSGLGESALALRLSSLIEAQSEVTIALYASEQTVRVRLACKAESRKSAEEKMREITGQIEKAAGDYIIPGDLTAALREILPPFRVDYKSDFRFRPEFLLGQSTGEEMVISVDTKPEILGVKLHLEVKYRENSTAFSIGLLKNAALNQSRLEARVVRALYDFLKTCQ